MSRKAIRKIMAVMIATIMMTGLAACGGGKNPGLDTAVSETAEALGVEADSSQTGEGANISVSNTTQDESDPSAQGFVETNDEGNIPGGLIDIYVLDNNHADFVYHGTDVNSVDFYLDEIYSVFIWRENGGDYQAGIQEKDGDSIRLCESSEYEISGDDIVIHADASQIPEVNFSGASALLNLYVDKTDGEYLLYNYKWDAVAQAGEYVHDNSGSSTSQEAMVADDSGSNPSRQTTSREATIEDLAEFAGTYVASNGDSFVIPAGPEKWTAVDHVKLDSVPGWTGSEGFYDTFVATNLSMDGDKIKIEVTSQYTVGTGLLVIEKNGKAGLSYVGFSCHEIVDGDYQNSTFIKR